MEFKIKSPTKAFVTNMQTKDGEIISKKLSYTNKSVSFKIKKHLEMSWWKKKDPVTWGETLTGYKKILKGCLLFKDGSKDWVRPGSIPYICEDSDSIFSEISYPPLKPIPWKLKPSFDPYPYQSDSVKELLKIKHGNISLPTGTGKSFILLMLSKEMGLNTVIITPGKSIFNELLVEFQKRLGTKYVGGYGDGKKDIKKKITIAIGKSLTMLKEGTEVYDFFKNKQVVCVDESHTFAAEQLNSVCHGVLAEVPYRFFVSATQTRNDGTEKLLQSIIGENVLEMELKYAIDNGYLCPLNFNILDVISPSSQRVRDPTKNKRIHFLYNPNIADLAAKIANASWQVKKQSTLILVEELRQISMLQKLLKVPFAYVHSADKKKADEWGLEKVKLQDQVDKFNNGEVKILIGTKAIATGTNIYPTYNTVNWSGGSSEIVTKQGPMGRSTRKLEISEYAHLHEPKPFSTIFDFNVLNQPMLEKQLEKRIAWYEESGGFIKRTKRNL